MKTIHYAGADLPVSDEVASELQAYLIALRFLPMPSSWQSIPTYDRGTGEPITANLHLSSGSPIVIVPAPAHPADPEGSAETAADLRDQRRAIVEATSQDDLAHRTSAAEKRMLLGGLE